jgi:long-chain acyl-CoA synthetase
MRVEDFLIESAKTFPRNIAVISGEECLTFRDLDYASDRLGQLLRHEGVARGDRVVIFMDNCAYAVTAIFAALKAGAVFSPVHPSTKPEKLANLLNKVRATALITVERLTFMAQRAIEQANTVKTLVVADRGETLATRAAPREPAAFVRGDAGIELDLAMLISTSGSTGLP